MTVGSSDQVSYGIFETCCSLVCLILLARALSLDEILKMLVQPMKAGVTCTVLMDCCHSGTVLDLPYRFSADDSQMRLDPRMNMEKYLGKLDVQTVMCLALLACCLADLLT